MELVAGAGSFELVDGATYTLAINTLLWGVDYTYNGTETAWDYPANWPDISHTVIGDRAIHIGSETVTLTQIGLLENTWADDYLSFGDGMTTSVFLSGYRVDITPLGLPVASVDSFNGSIDPPEGGFPQAPRTMYADFTVTAVPDAGATLALMAGALGGLAFIRRRRR
ncbi:MAG: VPDSG-CTERM sorting domain-containing protein [Verrucomicrobiales bacterium]|nr:VPDSG-CTERM sorting domain-containing protein [Verrucomicrobiales bacterium]